MIQPRAITESRIHKCCHGFRHDQLFHIRGIERLSSQNLHFVGNYIYVIRNGQLYRDTAVSGQEDLVIYEDGSFGIISEDEVTADELLADGVVNNLSFGPVLVENGKVAVGTDEEVAKAMGSNPRTAIGIKADGTYLFVVADGRTDESEGLSLYELADFMKELGAVTAYNLDGGGSSTMVFNGVVINNPTGGRAGHGEGTERSVSDIVYIGY